MYSDDCHLGKSSVRFIKKYAGRPRALRQIYLGGLSVRSPIPSPSFRSFFPEAGKDRVEGPAIRIRVYKGRFKGRQDDHRSRAGGFLIPSASGGAAAGDWILCSPRRRTNWVRTRRSGENR